MKKVRKKFFIFLIIFLITPFLFIPRVDSQEQDYFLADNLNIDLELNGKFSLSSSADYLKVYMYFFPEDSFNNDVVFLETIPEAEYIDYAYLYKWNKITNGDYIYKINSKINSYFRFNHVNKKIEFPIKELPKDVNIYVHPTKKIDINDKIITKASEIAYGEDDLFSVVFKLASWTKKNINYTIDSKTAEASQPASWVLDNKYGVCDELTNLFISMCRSLGIPARFVSGISYTNSELFEEKWGLHGWAEVYFPEYGWIPFDPTYGQYGYLDATHLKLKDSLDSDKSSTKFEWQAKNAELKPFPLSQKVNVLSQGNKILSPVKMEIRPLYDEIAFGSYNLIEVILENNNDFYLGFEISLNKPKELKILESERSDGLSHKYILLKPNQKKSVFWLVKLDEDLSKRYIYTFPLEVTNSFGYSVENNFKSFDKANFYDISIEKFIPYETSEKQEIKSNLVVDCSKPNIYVNETFNFSCSFENKGNIFLKNLRICVKNCQYIDLGIGQKRDLIFNHVFNKYGENNLSVIASNKDVNVIKKLNFFVEDLPKLTIEKVNIPDELKYEDFEVSFEIWKHSISKPKNVTVVFKFNEHEEKWVYDELNSNKKINIKIDKKLINIGNNNINITLLFTDFKNEKKVNYYLNKYLKINGLNIFIYYINKLLLTPELVLNN